MSATRAKKPVAIQDEIPEEAPQTIPQIGKGHPEYNFVQSILEMQKSLVEINCAIKSLEKSQDGIKTKVDDLVKWKQMIFGGAVVVGVMISVFAYGVSKASDYLSFKIPEKQPPLAQPAAIQPPSTALIAR